MAKKEFNTEDVTNKFFTQSEHNTHHTQITHNTQNTQTGRGYRYNLNLDGDLKPFLQKIAWENKTSITQYLNDIIRKEQGKYIKAGNSLDGWDK